MDSEIKRWQRSLVRDGGSETLSPEEQGFASRLSGAACELFRLFLEQGRLERTGSDYRALSRVNSYLQLWCDGYGAPFGVLDASLSESKGLRHDTYRLLVSICHTLADRLTTVLSTGLDDNWGRLLSKQAARTRDLIEEATFANGGDGGSDSASDSGSDASSIANDCTIEEIIKDLETDIRCLVDLGPRYKEPVRDRTVKEQPAFPSLAVNWDPAEHLASRIRHRYPQGDTHLTEVLGYANWERVKRLYASREANARAAERPTVELAAVPGAEGTVVAAWAYHLELEHGFADLSKEMTCPLCQEHIGSGRIAHLSSHLEEVALTILPANAESDDESDGDPEEVSKDEPNIPYATSAKRPVDPTPSGSSSRIVNVGDPGEKQDEPAWSPAIALYDLKPVRASELALVKGQNLWILKSAEKSPGAAWIPALCDKGQRQGWVPRSYARLTGNSSVAEGDGTARGTVASPEPPRPSTEFEFHTPWGESYQATLPSAFPPLAPLGEPLVDIGAERVEQTSVMDETTASQRIGKASGGQAASPPPAFDLPEEPNNEGSKSNPNEGDFVLFEGARDDLVYFPPLLYNMEGSHASHEVAEKHNDGKGLRGRVPTQPATSLSSMSRFRCLEPGCSAAFRRKDTLRRHQNSHDCPRGWHCIQPGCKTICSTEEELNQHHAGMHREPSVDVETSIKIERGVHVSEGKEDSLPSLQARAAKAKAAATEAETAAAEADARRQYRERLRDRLRRDADLRREDDDEFSISK
ncbi:hypothetical protein B0I37DRAFT_315039 [Chaetomium sp. MPI-CAGE-AT-0009]|nr:hypothetical protein B0I37DRAFT_315039 [Chaetomium sp. MPI-CAGE-AT-0009]